MARAYLTPAELERRQPILEGTGWKMARKVHSLEHTGADIRGRLAKVFSLPLSTGATGSVTVTTNPATTKTVVAGQKTYTWKDAIAAAGDVLIGATQAASALNLARAINEDAAGSGVGYHADTTINPDIYASVSGAIVSLESRSGGEAGNHLTLTSGDAGVTVVAFSGGAGDYETLKHIQGLLAAADLVGGSAQSRLSGDADLLGGMAEQAEAKIVKLETEAEELVAPDGTTVARLTEDILMDYDSSSRFATFYEDPVYYGSEDDSR